MVAGNDDVDANIGDKYIKNGATGTVSKPLDIVAFHNLMHS